MVIKKIFAGVVLVISLFVTGLGFASAASVKVGDPMANLTHGLILADPAPFTQCEDGTAISMAAANDSAGDMQAAVFYVGKRELVVMELDQTLYGDRNGKGLVTDIGSPDDDVFGSGPCDYLTYIPK